MNSQTKLCHQLNSIHKIMTWRQDLKRGWTQEKLTLLGMDLPPVWSWFSIGSKAERRQIQTRNVTSSTDHPQGSSFSKLNFSETILSRRYWLLHLTVKPLFSGKVEFTVPTKHLLAYVWRWHEDSASKISVDAKNSETDVCTFWSKESC